MNRWRSLLAFGFSAVLTAAGMEAHMTETRHDTIQTSDGAVEIYAVHHASLVLTYKGKHIFVDPAPVEEKGNAIAEFRALPKPDVIVYTHSHYDHYNAGILEAVLKPETKIVAPADVAQQIPASLRGRVTVMAYGDKAEIDGITVDAVAMYNTTPERSKFHPKGFGNGYILSLGGKRIYIAGDTEETPEIAHLAGIDAAFVPVNLPYTETVEAAARWVKDFKPGVVYPYHFRNGDGSLSDMAAFKAAVGSASDVRVLGWY